MIVAVNKCSITGLVRGKLDKLRWGSTCIDKDDIILENYIGFLDCDTVTPQVCSPDDCDNETIVFVCNIVIDAIVLVSVDEDTRLITFSVVPTGTTDPVTYEWDFNEEDFTAASAVNQSTLVLMLKNDKEFDDLVSGVTVTVTDGNGCVGTKTCYFVQGIMQCADDYEACPNASNLVIINKFVRCTGISRLVVTKKV